jgi:UDP-N-acetylmuramyl tripeptide synthase
VARVSDHAILTGDNPASEDPLDIARQIEAGLRQVRGGSTYEIIVDRAEAIARAISLARPGDAVVLARKGHEEYQITKAGLIPWSDREVARQALYNRPERPGETERSLAPETVAGSSVPAAAVDGYGRQTREDEE